MADLDLPTSMRDQLQREAQIVAESAAEAATHPADRDRIMACYDEVSAALET